MRKSFVYFFLFIFFSSSCEKDDFCTQTPITPNLILRFYDNDNKENLKSTSSLYVWAENKDTLFFNQAIDSLVIPLNTASNKTVYNLSEGDVINQLTIDYTTDYEYVSRSCGYKAIFKDVLLSSNNTWVKDITPTNITTIENQNSAHVQIFH